MCEHPEVRLLALFELTSVCMPAQSSTGLTLFQAYPTLSVSAPTKEELYKDLINTVRKPVFPGKVTRCDVAHTDRGRCRGSRQDHHQDALQDLPARRHFPVRPAWS